MDIKERGQSAVEYALLLVVVALVVIGVLQVLGVSLRDVFCQITNAMGLEVASCPANGAIFADDFSGDLDNWAFDRGGDWEQVDDQLCAGPGGEHRAYVKDLNVEDYTVSVDALLEQGNGYGLFFRANDRNVNGYTFQYDPGYGRPGAFIFRRWINGREMSPFRPYQSAPDGYQWYGTKRRVEIQVRGNELTARIDGQVVARVNDDAEPPVPVYNDGTVGLRTWSNTVVCFDNFQVTIP